jgi:hypothetical protein
MPGRASDPVGKAHYSNTFDVRLTGSPITANSFGFYLKDLELPIQDESEIQLYNLSVELLPCGRSGAPKSWQCGAEFADGSTRTSPRAVNCGKSLFRQLPTQTDIFKFRLFDG